MLSNMSRLATFFDDPRIMSICGLYISCVTFSCVACRIFFIYSIVVNTFCLIFFGLIFSVDAAIL